MSQEDLRSGEAHGTVSDESELNAVTLAKKMGGSGDFMQPIHNAAAHEHVVPLAPQPDRASHVNPPNRPARPPRKPSRQWY